MTSWNIDYAINYFRHHTLKKLHGDLNYNGLNCLCNLAKSNWTSVISDLDEGNHRHLGIGLTAVQCNAILNTLYIRTGNPGAVAPTGATQHKTVTLRDDYKKALELYKEITLAENAITNQVLDIVDERYVKPWLKEPPAQLKEWFRKFGQIEDENLRGKMKK